MVSTPSPPFLSFPPPPCCPCLRPQAGYICPAGSTSATQSICPAGQYSAAGSASCSPCDAGRWSATPGNTAAACPGVCSAGYACWYGSTSATQSICPAGQYSSAGWGSCSSCVAGRWSASPGNTAAACPGECSAGYTCPAGSTSATQSMCPAGQYSPAGATSCLPCSVGSFGASGALTTAVCSGLCPPGEWGATD